MSELETETYLQNTNTSPGAELIETHNVQNMETVDIEGLSEKILSLNKSNLEIWDKLDTRIDPDGNFLVYREVNLSDGVMRFYPSELTINIELPMLEDEKNLFSFGFDNMVYKDIEKELNKYKMLQEPFYTEYLYIWFDYCKETSNVLIDAWNKVQEKELHNLVIKELFGGNIGKEYKSKCESMDDVTLVIPIDTNEHIEKWSCISEWVLSSFDFDNPENIYLHLQKGSCSRCGRNNHTVDKCYASTNLKGIKLYKQEY